MPLTSTNLAKVGSGRAGSWGTKGVLPVVPVVVPGLAAVVVPGFAAVAVLALGAAAVTTAGRGEGAGGIGKAALGGAGIWGREGTGLWTKGALGTFAAVVAPAVLPEPVAPLTRGWTETGAKGSFRPCWLRRRASSGEVVVIKPLGAVAITGLGLAGLLGRALGARGTEPIAPEGEAPARGGAIGEPAAIGEP